MVDNDDRPPRDRGMADNRDGALPESAAVPGGKGGVYITKALARVRKLEALSDEMIDYLASVARNPNERTKHRVAAARILVEEHRWQTESDHLPERKFLAQFETRERAIACLDRMLRQLEAQTVGVLEEGG